MDLYKVIRRPLVTEKAMLPAGEGSRYVFEVEKAATKIDVRKAVEKMFKVNVTQVNTLIVRGKTKRVGRSSGRRSNWKKAFVSLKPGQKIEIFEGV